MHLRGLDLGTSGSEELIARRSDEETPEFDITAMVDLVFLMNLYFLVTFLTVAMGEMNLPAADHATALDADTAVVLSLARSLDGESVTVYLGDGAKGEPIDDIAEQEQKVTAAIEEGLAAGKTDVLLKAESKVRLADMFRISSLVAGHDLKLHVAVLERESKE
jgi:biopolymer transport protein ExbD